MGTVEPQVAHSGAVQEVTDGFHLVIDALKLNGIDTIFGLPGIPITDFTRMAQAAGMRVISFRHEQNAGNAAAIAGFMTQKPGICLTVSAPTRQRRSLAEGDTSALRCDEYTWMSLLPTPKPLCTAAFRVLHPQGPRRGVERARDPVA